MSETTTPREPPAVGSGRPAATGSPPGAAARARTPSPTCALDFNDPCGVGVLLTNEDPALFAREGRALLCNMPFSRLKPRPEMTMIGRKYSSLPGAAEGAAV